MLGLCNPQRLRTFRHLFAEKITRALKIMACKVRRRNSTANKWRRMKEMDPSQKEGEKASPSC